MSQIKVDLTPDEQLVIAHKFILDFISMFDKATRGGIHDFMEMTMFNMLNNAIKNIDDYLKDGHQCVDATEIMHIVLDTYQELLDKMKRNLQSVGSIKFK
jgi:hypothetical protein